MRTWGLDPLNGKRTPWAPFLYPFLLEAGMARSLRPLRVPGNPPGEPRKDTKPKDSGIRNYFVVADLHIGCQLGLCSPRGGRLDNGGRYEPSALQLKVHGLWKDFWKQGLKLIDGAKYGIIINGDLIEGCHHHSTHQWSHNLEYQANAAYELLAPVVEGASKLYVVRGTPAHSGESGVDEERLARRLGAVPNSIGQYARNELWLNMQGDLVHCAHHIGTTSSSAHETSAINAELSALFTESGRWGHQIPNVIVRSHRHRCAQISLPGSRGDAIAFVTAGWQLKSPFAYKVAGGRTTTPQIGGSLIRRSTSDGFLYTRHIVHDIGRGEVA